MNKLMMTAFFCAMAFALSTCSCSQKKENAESASPQKAETTVAVQTVSPIDLDDYIEFGGTVQAVDSVAVLPTVAGKIAKILVQEGDRVTQNQIIAQVDASKPGADFTMSPVRASRSGTVTTLPVSIGTYVTTSTTVAEIASIDNLEINVNVSERFVPLVKEEQTCEVSFKAFPNEVFTATVTRLSPVLDPATRTMQTTLRLSEGRGIIKAGMFAHVKLVTKHKEQILTVPTRAIVTNSGKPYVFIADSTGESATVRRVLVETGISVDGVTEITSGLRAGDAVVVKGQNMISDGQRVNAVVAE